MSDTIGDPLATRSSTSVETVREAYSFACMNCGYGWEQAYEIEHHSAKDGSTVFEYKANGVRVPSPLKEPTCPGCGGHKVRIMREGRVATVDHEVHTAPGYPVTAEPDRAPSGAPASGGAGSRWSRLFSRRSR